LPISYKLYIRLKFAPDLGETVRGGSSGISTVLLTLIRAAGDVYDFQNFEEVYLCNGSSSDLQNSCIPRKTSCEYNLLNTLERKTAFSAIYRPKRARKRSFFRRFSLFRTAVKVYDFRLYSGKDLTQPRPHRTKS
jgi:hypothetical protein